MAEFLTSKTRLLNIAGGGTFGYDPWFSPAPNGECRHERIPGIFRVTDPNLSPPFNIVRWAPWVRCRWLAGQCGAQCDATYFIEYETGAGASPVRENLDDRYRYNITIRMTMFRSPGPNQLFEQQFIGDWEDPHYIDDAFGVVEHANYGLVWSSAFGTYSFTEGLTLSEYADTGEIPVNGPVFERFSNLVFFMEGSCDFEFGLTEQLIHWRDPDVDPDGPLPPPPLFPPPPGSLPGGGGTDPDLGGYSNCNGEVPINLSIGPEDIEYEDDGPTGIPGYQWGRDYNLMGLTQIHTGSVDYGESSLACSFPDALALSDGNCELNGTADRVSEAYQFTGDPFADWVDLLENIPANDFPVPPSASVTAWPSWRLNLSGATCRDYETGAEIETDVDHRCQIRTSESASVYMNLLLGGLTTGGADYLYPPGGEAHACMASLTDSLPATGPADSQEHFEPLLGPATGDQPFPFTHAYMISPALRSNAFFAFDPAWGDAQGRFFDSLHFYHDANLPNRSRRLQVHKYPFFDEGEITIAATHQFLLFNDVDFWALHSNTAFLAANPGYGTSGVLSIVSGALRMVISPSGFLPTLITTAGDPTTPLAGLYRLRHFGYRYARLRIKGDADGLRVRIGLGCLRFSPGFDLNPDPWFWQWGWEVETVGVDSWADVEIDLARPQYIATGAGGTVTVSAADVTLHPSRFFPPAGALTGEGLAVPDGAEVWVEYLDPGTIDIDYLEGFHKTSGDRTPIAHLFPFDGYGDSSYRYREFELPGMITVPPDQKQVLRTIINGVEGFLIQRPSSVLTLQQLWNAIYDRLDDVGESARDTGINIVKGNDPDPMTYAIAFGHQFTESIAGIPFGKYPDPGVAATFRAQPRFPSLFGYYGMGDALGGLHGRTLIFAADWVWNGEVWGNTGGDPATPVLHNAPGGAVIDSDASNDDGWYRLFGKYAVRYPYTNGVFRVGPPVPAGSLDDPPPVAAWSASGGVITYTGTGQGMNPHWLKPGGLDGEVDGDGYLLVGGVGSPRFEVVIFDRSAIPLTFAGGVADGRVDICASATRLHRVIATRGRLFHESSADRGLTWIRDPMEGIAGGLNDESQPTICCDTDNALWIWWHDDLGARCASSKSFGHSWVLGTDMGIGIVGLAKFPRAVCTAEGLMVVMAEPNLGPEFGSVPGLSFWKLYPDGPEGLTFGPAAETLPAIPVALPSLRGDFRNRKHLVYPIGDALYHRAIDLRTISIPYLVPVLSVAAGKQYVVHQLLESGERGIYLFFNATNELVFRRTDFTLSDPADEATAPVQIPTIVPPQYVGVGADHFNWLWAAGVRADGVIMVWCSGDRGKTWQLV